MAYDPAAKIVIKVEISTALGWVDVTARGRSASCVIRQGRSAGAIQAETSRLSLTLGNPDGYLTEDNPVSPWYRSWGRGCEIRVSRIGLAVSPAERFHGQVDSIIERYPGGGVDATVEVTAVGTLGVLVQGSDPLRSALYRTMAGTAPEDYVPFIYWPMEDGSGAAQFASGVAGGTPLTALPDIEPAALAGPDGSAALPRIAAGASQSFTVPPYTSTQIAFQWLMQIPAEPAATEVLAEFRSSTGPVRRWEIAVVPGAPANIWLNDYDATNTLINATGIPLSGSSTSNPAEADFFGHWAMFIFGPRQNGGNVNSWAGVSIGPPGGGVGIGNTDAGTLGAITGGVLYGGSGGNGIGHLVAYTDPNFDLGFTSEAAKANVLAMHGYAGETAADRMARLCTEEGIAFELTGAAADTPAMGPQLIDTLVANLRDCERVDQGLMHDGGTDGAIVHVTRRHLYNQAATIAVVRGSLEPGLQATRDRQYTRNDVTSSRPGGGSARVADEDHIAKIRARLKDSRTVNTQTDSQLRHDAGWAVHLGTAPGARYTSVGINLRNADGALLADQVAAHAVGDRLTVAAAALPPQHVEGIDGLTVGWTELLDTDTWLFRANVMPYSPYEVSEYTDGAARYGAAGTTTAEALDTTETGVDITVPAGHPGWVTTASHPACYTPGMLIEIGGEQMRATACTSTGSGTYTLTVVRSVNGAVLSHASGLDVFITDTGVFAH